ncbi:MAG: precorrin-6A reductase [Ferroplasma sp.]|uniref:precorrin-6A reductase n=1 Tax=Ferroplasma sp. TaxID=2591003 RepID=UPI0028158BE3|nr:precorrin-6A reductase [Ferroplasma sp.]WMT52218.1 MAG: precorrin-6A reductase [Ferroplasma sp.]
MIMLFDGTSDSKKLAMELSGSGFDILATATTSDGVLKLWEAGINSKMGKLDYNSIIAICRKDSIKALIDGSHPYADSLHETCIRVSQELDIPLIRYERRGIRIKNKRIFYAENYESAEERAMKGNNVLITTGINYIEKLKGLINNRNAYVRIIPDPENIALLIKLGVRKDHIIAMEGNFDENLNKALMQYYRIDTLITKDSGFNAEPKVNAALSLGIDVIIISRKNFNWKIVCENTAEIKKILNDMEIK